MRTDIETAAGPSTSPRTAKQRIAAILGTGTGGTYGRVADWAIVTLIALNVVVVMLDTVESFHLRYGAIFYAFEVVSVAVFTLEYAARLWSCTEIDMYSTPLTGRLRYAGRPLMVVDLLAILPFYLGFFLVDARVLRALRLFRFFRLLKLARYTTSIHLFEHVVSKKRADLVVAFSATGILLVVSSSLMYFLEHEAQPEAFSSIPVALWWGVVTLTTVGYGDVYPVTPLGRVLGALIAMLGVGLFALPASLLASGFIEEARGETRETCPHCGEQLE